MQTSSAWTDDDVLAAAAEWLWLPDGTEVVDGDVTILRRPAWLARRVAVERTRSDRPAAELIDEASSVARGWEAETLQWAVRDDDAPDLAAELEARGAVVDDVLDILGLPLAGRPELPQAPGVQAEGVDAREQLAAVGDINAAVWGDAPLGERLGAEFAELRRILDEGTGFRVLASLDGVPAATGGVTLAPGPRGLGLVARLWGAATVESQRGRGLYRAVLDERLRRAAQAGAELALVKGRITTSAPILKRAGFRRVGGERRFVLPL
ncbi:hypothetical protein E4U02_10615 [Microbacterium paludicola]|uniref:N-acetyltransferase domain-containing protein n=1 Tax=Microbacterium paludicola TaxID=300019 RepID=A0A4Y9FV82_9MICO|nr:hypothetical protein [Microbacterium paludicola]MBF0816865.1 hypothetical protein [Microbacterium paludicola]TFU32457.1 hypothetical protein E4U02_10615 [Microbacterium paludicola]